MKRKKKNIICYIIVIIVIIILILSIFIVPVSRNNKYKKGILNDIYSNTDIKYTIKEPKIQTIRVIIII